MASTPVAKFGTGRVVLISVTIFNIVVSAAGLLALNLLAPAKPVQTETGVYAAIGLLALLLLAEMIWLGWVTLFGLVDLLALNQLLKNKLPWTGQNKAYAATMAAGIALGAFAVYLGRDFIHG
jgi:hypothetical protein